MQIQNRFGLPQPFVDAVSTDSYTKGESDYTTTGLLKPPKIVQLEIRHWDAIETDASERVWSMSGTARHTVLERVAALKPERYVVEKRMYADFGTLKIGGQIDLYDIESRTLYDWKETSVWKVMLGGQKEWDIQGNINKLLCGENGIQVEEMFNIAILKDWKRREAQRKRDYPQCAIQAVKLNEWTHDETHGYIESRINLHEQAKRLADDDIPVCTPEERWENPPQWATMKDAKAKRALKLHGSREAAQSHADSVGGVVQDRPSEATRCLYYCPVRQWCNYGRTLKMPEEEIV